MFLTVSVLVYRVCEYRPAVFQVYNSLQVCDPRVDLWTRE